MASTNTINGKRTKQEGEEELLPGLPDHLAQLCLSLVPPNLLYSVCRSWQRLIYSSSFPPFLSIYSLLSSPSNSNGSSSIKGFFSFDPMSATWVPLPSPPRNPPLRLLLRHPSFISRPLPVQSVALSGHLLVLAATTNHLLPAISRPLVFRPASKQWHLGPPISIPRRWCAAGSVEGAVYMASGVGAEYSAEVARRAERWDLLKGCWERVAGLRDGRFSREAVEAVGLRGKLCMVNVKGNAAKEGAVYDVGKDEWEDMPGGLLRGWKGPTAAMDEKVMYAVLEEEEEGVLMEYNPDVGDVWTEVVRSVHLRGAVQIAAAGGRVCAVCSGGLGIVVVDVVAKHYPRIWLLPPPPSSQVLSIHVLPRMSSTSTSALSTD